MIGNFIWGPWGQKANAHETGAKQQVHDGAAEGHGFGQDRNVFTLEFVIAYYDDTNYLSLRWLQTGETHTKEI